MNRSTLVFGICLLIIGLLSWDEPLTAAANIAFGISLVIFPQEEKARHAASRKVAAYSLAVVAMGLMITVITVDFLT